MHDLYSLFSWAKFMGSSDHMVKKVFQYQRTHLKILINHSVKLTYSNKMN